MKRKFDLKVTLGDDGVANCRIEMSHVTGGDVLAILTGAIIQIAKAMYTDDAERNCFIYDLSHTMLAARDRLNEEEESK